MITLSEFTRSLLPASTIAAIEASLNSSPTSKSTTTGTQADYLKGTPLKALIDSYNKSRTSTASSTAATVAPTFATRSSATSTVAPGPEQIDSRGNVPTSTQLLAFRNTVDFAQFKEATFASFVLGSGDLGEPVRLNDAYNAAIAKYGATVLLGYDVNGNGKLDNESELFGFDDGDPTTSELGSIAQFAPGVGTLGGYNTAGVTTETANAAGVQQVDRVAFGSDALDAGDQYQIGINGNALTYSVAAGDTTANVIDNFVTQINAAGLGVTALNDSGTLLLTADAAGTGFTTTAAGADAGEASITGNIDSANFGGSGQYGQLMFLTASGQSYSASSFYAGVLGGVSSLAELRFNYDALQNGAGTQFQVNLIL